MNVLTGRGNKRLVRAISRSSNEWKKVGSDFRFRATNIFIASFFETAQTGGKLIVDQDSANLGLSGEKIRGLPRTNHRNICKFGDSREESDRFLVLGIYITWIAKSALGRGQ
ncbi:hypothetical protein TGAMA5MH_00974 [Trichoderma gamsii]|uniref:Uncharacterized protein n=1 Tax=Trichoderma gamsii TaxID=398673 RepID=A0A2K0TQW7_9HYPO|nr:hypothetical protein TGAMA5MH_00974 [Trichoderma gamsii]